MALEVLVPEYRTDRLSWADRWMLDALISSQRSSDPSTQVGAVIVTPNNKLIANGYNGPPRGINPCQIPWDREADSPKDTKYPYIIHAETNAIHNATISTKGCILYTTLYPCSSCAGHIIQAGIKEVIYLSNKYEDTWESQAAAWMFGIVDISTKQHQWETDKVLLCLQNLLALIK